MHAATPMGTAQRLNRDVIPFRRRIGDAPAPWGGIGGGHAERPRRAFARDDEIFVEGDSAAVFYKLVTGAVRTYRLLNDGRRQIDAFHFAGDAFGLEGGDRHQYSAAAICDVTVAVSLRSELRTPAGDAGCSAELMTAMMRRLEQAQGHMVLLGCKNAREKVATFLLGIAARTPRVGNHVELPMMRCDIADHLGLTIETVSRTIAELARDGVIGRPGRARTFALRDLAALRHLSC
jgi:CRP/FNR family transcriptional regulator, nitrogen fixation regulation protein